MSKSVLNELCIKNKWQSPVYSTTKHGPDHIPTFHATVTVNDATFASESVAKSSKEAQNDAARIAVLQLTAAAAAASELMYKSLLQEKIQKKGGCLPNYETRKLGQVNAPTFISTVEVEGQAFTGHEAKSKKLAEMSAAKVAYTHLMEGKHLRNMFGLLTYMCCVHINVKSPCLIP
ncbi:Double-stranded RNA-binding protein 4 [Linum perenne]